MIVVNFKDIIVIAVLVFLILAGVACHLSNVIREEKVKREIKNKHKK